MASVSLQGIGARYGRIHALDGVDLDIADGSCTVVFGPAGAGKTTLLNVVAGLKETSAGRVLFDGTDMSAVEPWDRDVAMVFESYALYAQMSVYDNLMFPLKRRRYERDRADNEIHALARVLGIEQLLGRKPGTLSNGQRQRVGLGRALIRPSRVLLMDEPLSHLDAKLANSMRLELKLIQRQFGRTVVYVTHNYREALGLADQLAILDKGKLVQVGTPQEIFERPATEFVCRLIGEPARNMLPLRLHQGSAGGALLDGSAKVEVPSWLATLGPPEVLASVLPSEVAALDGADGLAPGVPVLEVVVRTVERKGSRNVVEAVTVGGTDISFYARPGTSFEVHQRLQVSVTLGRAVYLDPSSGLAFGEEMIGQATAPAQPEQAR